MEHKNSVPYLLIVLLSAAGLAHADCYYRSSNISRLRAPIERIADLERTVMPVGQDQNRCRVTFRALILNQWHTVEGESTGPITTSLDQICGQALNLGRTQILDRVSGSDITASQEMICTDQPIPRTRDLVAVGDIVRDSEVQPHPIHRRSFGYRGSECRWFVESRPESGRVDMNQGIICRGSPEQDWRVVDKW